MSGNDSGITPGNQQSLEQGNVNSVVAKNEANAASSFAAGTRSSSSSDFIKFPKLFLDEGKQWKHRSGRNNFQPGKSELTVSMSEASKMVSEISGKGTPAGDNKEHVISGKQSKFIKIRRLELEFQHQ